MRAGGNRGGGHAGLVAAFLDKYYGAGGAVVVDEPLHTQSAKARFGLVTVTIGGEQYVVVDIGMRMLTPRELFRAQGFGDDYKIDVPVRDPKTGRFKSMTRTAQIRLCGNSVCPPLAEALARANLGLEAERVAA